MYKFPTDALQVPGLVQGGLTIIILRSSLDALNYARLLNKMGIRALYVDGLLIHQLEHTDDRQCSELDVLLFHSSNSHEKMSTFLASLRRPIALLAIEAADRASRLSPRHSGHYIGWAPLGKLLRPRSFVCSTHVRSAEVVNDMHRIYELSKSSTTVVKENLLSNLSIDAVTLPRNHDKFSTVLRLLEKRSGPTVILTATQMNAEDVATKLQAEGYDAKAICLPKDRGETRRRTVAELVDASNEILCVPKTMAIHLPLPKARQIIWHSLAYSPQQFNGINKVVCQDGEATLCTVLLSEQEIFNAIDITLAMSPSLHQMRLFMAEIFRGREVLEAGFSFVIETMRVRYLADLEDNDLATLMKLFHDEGIWVDRRTSYLHVDPGPRLQVAHQSLPHPMEFDLVKALEEAIGSRLDTRPGMLGLQLDAFLASGLLQNGHEKKEEFSVHGHGLKVFHVIVMERDFSRREADDIIQKFSARMSAQTIGRMNARRQYLELFTTKSCFVASLAKAIQIDVPSEWKACGQCLFCVTHKPVAVTPFSQIEKPVDLRRLNPIIYSVPAQFAKDPRFLARIALGKLSTRVKALGLYNNRKIFGSMRLNSFEVCTKEKSKNHWGPYISFGYNTVFWFPWLTFMRVQGPPQSNCETTWHSQLETSRVLMI